MSASQGVKVLFKFDAIAVQGVCFPIEAQFRVGIALHFVFDVIGSGLLLRSLQCDAP